MSELETLRQKRDSLVNKRNRIEDEIETLNTLIAPLETTEAERELNAIGLSKGAIYWLKSEYETWYKQDCFPGAFLVDLNAYIQVQYIQADGNVRFNQPENGGVTGATPPEFIIPSPILS